MLTESTETLPALIRLRRELHGSPELSGAESRTRVILKAFLQPRGLEPIAEDIAGHGLLYRIPGPQRSPELLFRADMDAVAIDGAPRHACGHDGHLAMLAGALVLLQTRPQQLPCSVNVLFQPAEETGKGMQEALNHPALRGLNPDHVFAIHNLPGHPLGTVLLPVGAAAPASTGIKISLRGESSHASEPQLGNSPIPLLCELAVAARDTAASCRNPALVTITWLKAGEENYGSTPGVAELGLTLRADMQEDLEQLLRTLRTMVETGADAHGLSARVELHEPFPATTNSQVAVEAVERAAMQARLPARRLTRPFPWSEDFGHATRRWPGALIGLGAGEHQPALHSRQYEFPDALLPIGVALWLGLVGK